MPDTEQILYRILTAIATIQADLQAMRRMTEMEIDALKHKNNPERPHERDKTRILS